MADHVDQVQRQRVTQAFVAELQRLMEANPSLDEMLPLRERCAALAFQLGWPMAPPDPEVEHQLAEQGLVINPVERDPLDAELDELEELDA